MGNRKKFIPVCEPTLLGNERKYVEDAVRTGWISSSGKYVHAFENAFAEYCGLKYGVGVCNGTVALHLALVSLGIGPGDEVIVPDFTMIASAFSVVYTGAKPAFVDADPTTWNIDVSKIKKKITQRTKAIMPVHIFGNPCDMNAINAIAKKYDLYIIEDAAESHGAVYRGKKTGSHSHIAAFSFYANKNITTGEGGMVVTDDPQLYDKARYHKNLCFNLNSPREYKHNDIGFNYRLSNVHAAIGLAQVEKADVYKAMRIHNGHLYRHYLSGIEGLVLQVDQEQSENVFWMNGILLKPDVYGKSREQLMAHLMEKGIDSRLFFTGLHEQPSLIRYGCIGSGEYPVSVNLARNGFYLPSASNLEEKQIEYICSVIRDFSNAR